MSEEEAFNNAASILENNDATFNTYVSDEDFQEIIDVDIRQFPSFMFVDSNGNVIKISITSFFDEDVFNTMIDDYLKDGFIDTNYDPDYEMSLTEPYYEDGE